MNQSKTTCVKLEPRAGGPNPPPNGERARQMHRSDGAKDVRMPAQPKEKWDDLTAQRFGRWIALRFVGTNKHRAAQWLCRCDCGQERTVTAQSLKRLESRSCGCYGKEIWRESAARMRARKHGHGLTDSPTYKTWKSMIGRCSYPDMHGYHNYGGRGITVCERWKTFENFLADMGVRPEGMTLDRIDGDGNYEPSNCRWATNTTQRRNSKQNVYITFQGKTQCLADWAREIGLSSAAFSKRIARWPLERALTAIPRGY